MIDEFNGEYSFLSNFYPAKVTVFGIEYQNAEAAFQACKTLDINVRRTQFSNATASEAKTLGHHISLRVDWGLVKFAYMKEVCKRKFQQNPDLLAKLLATRDEELVEGNCWHDNLWGNCTCKNCSNIHGENRLGKILMDIREQYRGDK